MNQAEFDNLIKAVESWVLALDRARQRQRPPFAMSNKDITEDLTDTRQYLAAQLASMLG